MQVYTVSEKDRQLHVAILTEVSPRTGKEVILVALHYWDIPAHRIYNKTFPASKYDQVKKAAYALYNRETTPEAVFNGHWMTASKAQEASHDIR